MVFNFTPVPSAGFNPGFLRGATGQDYQDFFVVFPLS
jgi:hypothetical protein